MQISSAEHQALVTEVAKLLIELPPDPQHEFTIKMLLEEMGKANTEKNRKQMRRQLETLVNNGQLQVRRYKTLNVYYET